MSKKLVINLKSLDDAGKRFVAAWNAAKRGEKPNKDVEFLTFENLETLLKVLTPKRFELLKKLRSDGPCSVRHLSQILKRDYSNVYTDVKQLIFCGLIERSVETNEVYVPWAEVVAHFSFMKPSIMHRARKRRPLARRPHIREPRKKAS